jgi:hypothetical protein
MNWAANSVVSALVTAIALAGSQSLGQDDITIEELGAVHPLEVETGGNLPDTVWSSGNGAALASVLSALPSSADGTWDDAAAARLALNALLSGGPPPEANPGEQSLAVLRADRALAASRAEPVYVLLSRTPDLGRDATLSQLYVETAFALGHLDEACHATAALLEGRDEPYWLRARAACLAFDGSIPAAELTSELARATAPNPAFDRVFDPFTLGSELPDKTEVTSGLQLAVAAQMAPETRIAVSETAPEWLKRAAERTGPMIRLPETLPEALEAAVQMDGADRETALGALIQQDIDRVIAAEALAIRLQDAHENTNFLAVADAYGPEVARLPITADTLANGVLFVMAALGADDIIAAADWRQALIDGPPKPEPEPIISVPTGLAPGSEIGPSELTSPPEYANPIEDEMEWDPPEAASLVAMEFARKIAEDDIRSDAFSALLNARLENASAGRLCQSAALVALGADDGGALRAAMLGAPRSEDAASPALGPILLAGRSGALGETQLMAADLLNRFPNDPESCAVAAMALDLAGLRATALRVVLEQVIEDRI